MHNLTWQRHRWLNRLQTAVLMLALLSLCALAGNLLFGNQGIWLALGAGLLTLLIEPAAIWRLTLHLYRARPICRGSSNAMANAGNFERTRRIAQHTRTSLHSQSND